MKSSYEYMELEGSHKFISMCTVESQLFCLNINKHDVSTFYP